MKLDLEIKNTQSLCQLGFTRKLANEDKIEAQSNASNDTETDVQLLYQNKDSLGPEYQNDIGLWQKITNEVQNFWCDRDPVECQHFDDRGEFSVSSRQYEDSTRKFTRSMIFRKHVSGKQIKREWLIYSPSTGNVYCFPCILFGGSHKVKSQFSEGFNDWENASCRMKMHEDIMLEYFQNNNDEYQKGSKLVLKRLTDTRWSARADATKALSQSYNCFQKALQFIVKDTNQTQETIYEAKCLLKVSKSLQKETIELRTAIDLLKSLLKFLTSLRDKLDDYERKANMKTDVQYTDESSCVRVRKRHSDDDKLHAELFRRMKAYDNVYSIFGFLTKFPLKTDDEIKEAARRFSENYREDIETEFINEMVHFKYFISQVDELKADETVPALRSLLRSLKKICK
ncbi:hypothetical protein QTP88_020769 [Uroleucon formosanum]